MSSFAGRGDSPAVILAFVVLAASGALLVDYSETLAAMFGLSFAGLLAAALLGLLSGRRLALLGAGVAAICWALVIVPSPVPGLGSALAHFAGGALVAWVIAEPVRERWPWMRAPRFSPRWFALPLLVLAIGGAWELGEWLTDRLLETNLSLDHPDTLTDLAADTAGAVTALALRDRRRQTSPPADSV